MAARAGARDRAEAALAGRPAVLGVAVCFLAAAYFGLVAMALLAAACLALVGLSWASAWLSTWRVYYERSLSARRAFPGETLRLCVRVANRKPLPAPWLEVGEELPAALLPAVGAPLRRLLHLPWHSAASWQYDLQCRRRGCYSLGAAALHGGDPYGLAARALAVGVAEEVIIYPRLLPLAQVALPARAILGRQRPPSSLCEDPSRLAGLRDYRPGDPVNRVHWKATARQGTLQVKVYEPTTTPLAVIVLAVEGLVDEQLGEHAISVAATLAYEGAGLGWAVGLIANGSPAVALGPGAGRDQVPTLLEALARLHLTPALPLPAALAAAGRDLPAGATIIFVGAGLSPELLASATEVAAAGHALAFVLVAGEVPAGTLALGRWPVFAAPWQGV